MDQQWDDKCQIMFDFATHGNDDDIDTFLYHVIDVALAELALETTIE